MYVPAYLKYNGFSFGFREFVENGVHDFEVLRASQCCWCIFFEVVDEIVQQEVCTCRETDIIYRKGKKRYE